MQIKRETDYAVRAVIHLAGVPEGARVSAAEIARAEDIPPKYVSKVLHNLSRAGMVSSVAGAGGGASLSVPADTLSVGDVVVAMEGQVALNRCLLREKECPRDSFCLVHDVWMGAQEAMMRQLKRARIDQLAEKASETRPSKSEPKSERR